MRARPYVPASEATSQPRAWASGELCPVRCDLVAVAANGRTYLLDAYGAASPLLAARWLNSTVHRLIRRFDPDPAAPFYGRALIPQAPDGPDPAGQLRGWLGEGGLAGFEEALATLATGQPTRIEAHADDARYVIAAAPVPLVRPPHYPLRATTGGRPAPYRTAAPRPRVAHWRHT